MTKIAVNKLFPSNVRYGVDARTRFAGVSLAARVM